MSDMDAMNGLAVQRANEARQRADTLQRHYQDLADRPDATDQQLQHASRVAVAARESAASARQSLLELLDRSAVIHQLVAGEHDRAADAARGYADKVGHAHAAERHRAAARRDRGTVTELSLPRSMVFNELRTASGAQFSRAVPSDLAVALRNLVWELQAQSDAEGSLQTIVASAAGIVRGVRWAGVSLFENGRVRPGAASTALVAELELLQSELNEGPCTSGPLGEHNSVLVADMQTATEWPRFAPAAHERGVGSLLSIPLLVRDRKQGALNLYAAEPNAFDDSSVALGEILARHACVALQAAASLRHFEDALANRDVIGQAQGLLMQHNNLTALDAIQLMMRGAEQAGMTIADFARRLIQQHEMQISPFSDRRSDVT